MKQRIKDIVDHIVVEREYPRKLVLFEQILELLIPYALQSYMNCRDIIQYTLGQMERIPIEGVSYFFVNLRPLIETLRIIKGKASILDYINVDWNGDMMALVERVGPHIAGEQKICDLRKSVAYDLTFEERRFLTSSIIGYIQGNGVKSQWGNDIFQNAFMFCNLLYPICKKDDVMDLLFHSYNNIIDRLNTSGHSQHARDHRAKLRDRHFAGQRKGDHRGKARFYRQARGHFGARSRTDTIIIHTPRSYIWARCFL